MNSAMRALAETMLRACTEDGLWDRLAAGIKPPPERAEMVDGYLQVYRQELWSANLAAE
ncbi:MAG TPA: hypothetical protein VEQ16_09265 [Acidocella sp.]|nr:hypothetical protein [Acidocella sp.]